MTPVGKKPCCSEAANSEKKWQSNFNATVWK